MKSPGVPVWGAFEGNTLEMLMGVFLLRENRDSHMRTPSSGDGGVDVYEPFEDGYRVYQVKKYWDRIGGDERPKIKKSLATVKTAPRLDKPVKEWLLVMPTILTSGEEIWFKEMVKNAGFPCGWRDEAFWISLCAKYPDVVDWYLGNGRERVRRNVRTVRELLEDPGTPVIPTDVLPKLQTLRSSINDESPHYRFEFRTSATTPGPPPDQDLLVMSVTAGSEEHGCVTWDVYAKFPQACDLEPITGKLCLRAVGTKGEFDITKEIEEFFKFGRGVDIPDGGFEDLTLNAPGGLGETVAGAGGRLGPAYVETFRPHKELLTLEDGDGNELAAVSLDAKQMTRGRSGFVIEYTDAGGAFNVNVFVEIHESAETFGIRFSFTPNSLDGLRAVDVLLGIQLMAQIRDGVWVVIRPDYGPGEIMRGQLSGIGNFDISDILALTEDLAVIQTQTAYPVTLPAVIPVDLRRQIRMAAVLIGGGDVTGTWDELRIELGEGDTSAVVEMGEEAEQIVFVEDLEIELDARVLQLGVTSVILEQARVAENEGGVVRFVPGESDRIIRRLGSLPTDGEDLADPALNTGSSASEE